MAEPVTTLQDLINMKKLEGLRLIAGQNGLDREVYTCCILDYEYDPELKNKFSYTNFKPGMLLLTSFMYAKDREYLISDAIRQLIATGISGLAIKNVYHLRIQDSVLRYADSRSFPIFLIDDPGLFVEPIIYSIHEGIGLRRDLHRHGELINAVLRQPLCEEEETTRAYALYPMLGHYFAAFYFRCGEAIPDVAWIAADGIIRPFCKHMIYQFGRGALLLVTAEIPDVDDARRECSAFMDKLISVFPQSSIGMSDIHYSPSELRFAIEESIQASLVLRAQGEMHYKNIGSYQILFSGARDARMKAFSERILNPLFDYDVQNEGRLQKTLFGLIECGGNLHELSDALGQHENTLRQRLARIAALTGLDFRNTQEYEQLSLAVKIHNCIRWSESFPD